MNENRVETVWEVVLTVILTLAVGYLIFGVWAVRKTDRIRLKAEAEATALEQRLEMTVKLLEQNWGNRATAYRKGNQIALIVTNPDKTWYVSEFLVYPDFSTETLHYGLLCPSEKGTVPVEKGGK